MTAKDVNRSKTHHRIMRRVFWLGQYKMSKGCELCGYNKHPAALQFDHIDPKTKLFTISSRLSLKRKTLIAEVRKCRVLCANCHYETSSDQRKAGVVLVGRKRLN
jgi:hypothetical protein